MGQNTTPIQPQTFYRQSDKPVGAPDGSTWQNPKDGANGNTSSRYVYNLSKDRWELDSAVGPDQPSDGTSVSGALWRDTSNGTPYQYDGSAWVALGTVTASPISDESSNRSGNTVYTNSTGAPLLVSVAVGDNANSVGVTAYLIINTSDFVGKLDSQNDGDQFCMTGVVPDGADYEVQLDAGQINNWYEQPLK